MGCSHPTPRCVPRSFHPQGAKQVTSLLCLAFRARQSTRTRPPLRVRYPVPVLARLSWARLLTKPLGAVWNGERRFAGRKPGRPFVNECSISNGTLSPLRRPLDDHRRHRTSPRHCEDPRPPRLARPRTAPIARAVIRPTPWIWAPRTDESPEKSPILDRRLTYLTTYRSISYSSSRQKRVL
jgi:hypothetical protein